MKKLKFLPFYLISYLPFPVLYTFSDLLFLFAFYAWKYRRKVVEENIRNSFPEKTAAEQHKIVKSFYRHFCDLIFESIKTLTMNEKSADKHFKVRNRDFIRSCYDADRNIIIHASHLGNWEWYGFLFFNVPHQCVAFYKPLSNKYFNELILLIRTNFGALCFDSQSRYKSVYKLSKDATPIISLVISDQSPSNRTSASYWLNFLNRKTAFLSGAEKMAQRFNHILVYPKVIKPKRGVYEIYFECIADRPDTKDSQELMEVYVDKLEDNIRLQPELWLWSHKRWKLSQTA